MRTQAELIKTAKAKLKVLSTTAGRQHGEFTKEHIPLTPAELAAVRAHILKATQDGNTTEYTCDDCTYANCCPFVFDPYNVSGDCIVK